MGRDAFEPTEEQRRLVREMTGFGFRQSDIARVIAEGGIDLKTLRKYFREELDTGKVHANMEVARTLFNQATGGNTTAMIFWLKTQAQWRETNHHEIDMTSKNDGASLRIDPKDFPEQERAALLKVIHKRLQGAG